MARDWARDAEDGREDAGHAAPVTVEHERKAQHGALAWRERELIEDQADEDSAAEDEPSVAPIPLGNIVRYERDRVHPESLPLEAVDVLRRIIDGDTSEVVDRALADLLGL